MQQEHLQKAPTLQPEAQPMDVEEHMTDFAEKLREYRQLARIRARIRKVPAQILNRRHKKLQEVEVG